MSRAPIFVRVWNGSLVPADAYGQEQVAALTQGQEFNARLSRVTATGREEREGLRGLWWGALTMLAENTERQDYDTKDKAHEAILRGLGYVRPRFRADMSFELVPISTADGSMDDEEFLRLLERAAAFLVEHFGYDPFEAWKDEQTAKKANQQKARR